MSDSVISGNLFAAAKQLAESEIQLLKVIENSKQVDNKNIISTMSTKRSAKKSGKTSNVRPSAALIAAKREAVQRQLLQGKESNNVFVQDIYQKAIDSYNVKRKETGLVFDRSMEEHKCLWDPNYPECPARLTSILQRCEELGLISRCKFIASREATENEILGKHSQKILDILKATSECTDVDNLELLSSKYDAIYVHPSTYKLSLLAVGSTINLVESVCKGEVQNGMAIIRPPGHHAMKSEYCGYCFFNNVAIAAEEALSNNWANKILIIDWDVHHGQATQQMFYNDPRVIYFSIHRYENGMFWPNLRESDFHFVGDDLGQGYNFNVPLNKVGMTNADYLAIFQQVLLPLAYEFQPDLVIVSAGYDAALGCAEGEMLVTPAFYAHLVSSLMSLASGKVAVVLEGGYYIKSLAESAALTLRALLGEPCPKLEDLELPSLSIRDSILNTIYSHRPYWKCYQYQDMYSINSTSNKEPSINQHLPVVTFKGTEDRPDKYETSNCYLVHSKEVLEMLDTKFNALVQFTNLSKVPNKVCIVYDERMLKHSDISDDTHPEKPNRISGIYKRFKEYNILDRCYVQQGRSATMEELLLAHSKDHIDRIKGTASLRAKELKKLATTFNSVYLHPETWTSACVSTGSLLQVVDSVLKGESQSGVAIVRPPGHHAGEDMLCGFCIFNNIAVAAKYAIECHHLKKVLIVDWDVHHGNGTQSIFEEDPRVLYMSVHRYDNGSFFPNSKNANYTYVGSGAGEGFNVNIPWNKKGMGDAEYIAAFQQVVMPIAYQYNPELILVSAGFDACIGDPLGGCLVSPEMYGHLTSWLSSLANGRLILSLEGGYNINSISHAMAICTKTLLGDPLPMLESGLIPCTSAIHSINNALKTQKQYWSNLIFNVSLPRENVLPKATLKHVKSSEQVKTENKPSKQSESKIALEEIESEKLELKLSIDKNFMTDEEIVKLQNEVENIKIKNSSQDNAVKLIENTYNKSMNVQSSGASEDKVFECVRQCVNQPGKEVFSNKNNDNSNPGGSGEQNEGAIGRVGAATNLYDYLSQNLQSLIAGEMFAVVPLRECPHLDSVRDVPNSGIDVHLPCTECANTVENWICLQCYTVHCARTVNQHGLLHAEELDHPLALSFSDLSVWCYRCEAYIDNPRLFAARNAAHQSKFNDELPWTYNEN